MEHKLLEEPVFPFEALMETVGAWKSSGARTVGIEWSTGKAPTIFYYPEGQRVYGKKWVAEVGPESYSELYADFIEYKLVPRMTDALTNIGFVVKVRCVDLQPLQVQRQRRHMIEREIAHSPGSH